MIIIILDIPLIETWREMEKLKDEGLVKRIGVSNFTLPKLKSLLEQCTVKPVVNQVYCFFFINDSTSRGDTPNFLEIPEVVAIAKKHNKTAAQVLLRYSIQNNIVVIPKSRRKERIIENFNIFDFKLDDDDMKVLKGFDKHNRLCLGAKYWGSKTQAEFWDEN